MRALRRLAAAAILSTALAAGALSDARADARADVAESRAGSLATLESPPLVLHHAPEQAGLARMLAARGPAEVTRIALTLGIPVPDRIDVHLLPTRAGDPEVHGLPGAPDWAAGYAMVDRPEIVLRTTQTHGPTGNDAATVFAHELVHSLISQAVGARRHDDMPAWFVEGIASHLAFEWRLVHSAHAAGFALSGPYVPLRHLEDRFPPDSARAQLAYLESFAFLDWLTERSGEDALRRLLERFRAGATFDEAFREAFGAPWSVLEDEWQPGFMLRHRWVPIVTSSATLWAAVVGLFVTGAFMKRRRTRAKLAAWEQEERLLWPDELPVIGEAPGGATASFGSPEPADASESPASSESSESRKSSESSEAPASSGSTGPPGSLEGDPRERVR